MANKASPRSNSSSASSASSSSRKIYNKFGRGQVVHDSRGGNVAEIGRLNHGSSTVDKNDGLGLSWRSDKQAVDRSAAGRSNGIQPSNLQNMWRGQASFTPGGTWKEQGAIRGAWNQSTRPQSRNVENMEGSRFPSTSIGERRRWEMHPPSVIGQEASSSSEAISSNHFPPLPSFNVSMGITNEPVQEPNSSNWIASSNEQQHRNGRNSGWESPGYMGASTNRRREGFDGNVRAVPELVSRDSFKHKERQEFDVRKVDNHGSTSSARQARNFKDTTHFNSASTARGLGGYHEGQQEFSVRKTDTRGNTYIAGQGRNNNFVPSPSVSTAGRIGSYQKGQQEIGMGKVDTDGSTFLVGQGRNSKETLSFTSESTAGRLRGHPEGRQEFGVRKVDTDRRASHVGQGRDSKDTMPFTSASIAGRLGVYKKEAAAGQSSGAGESKRHALGVEDNVLAPKGRQGSLSISLDSEGIDDGTLPFVVGSCQDMCPASEREQRERLRDLAVFERLRGNSSKTTRELAVKKFCRTFSGISLQPSDIRPLPVLWRTLQYLLNLLDDCEFSFEVVHSFLFDRTRAIRQELGMQRIANSQAITIYEEIIRFHILSEHELSQRGSGKYASDSHLNLQQLSKALTSLFDLYDLKTSGNPENEPEFRAYHVLLNLGSLSRYQNHCHSRFVNFHPDC